MDKKIKMIAADLDGTLLRDDKTIDLYTLDVISKAVESGVIFVIATGRPYNGVPQELLDIKGIRYAMTSNGARVVDTKTGESVIKKLLPRESWVCTWGWSLPFCGPSFSDHKTKVDEMAFWSPLTFSISR